MNELKRLRIKSSYASFPGLNIAIPNVQVCLSLLTEALKSRTSLPRVSAKKSLDLGFESAEF